VINSSIRETLDEYFGACPEVIRDQTNFIFFNTKDNHFKKPIKRVRLGEQLQQFVTKWVCEAISAPIAFEKPGDTVLECKVWT
jgi:hypothetical protein